VGRDLCCFILHLKQPGLERGQTIHPSPEILNDDSFRDMGAGNTVDFLFCKAID
jgi:hypothetical protein